LTTQITETRFQWKVPQPKGWRSYGVTFAQLVVSYSVEDFEKQTPSTIPQNQHAAKEDVDNKYFALGHTDEKNYQSRQRLNNINK
jgi:hypothetical protein